MIFAQIKSDLKRIFVSPKIYGAVACVFFLCYISTEEYIQGNVDIFYILDLLIGLSVFKKLIVIFAALPCVTGFYDDWKNQYIKNIVMRGGKSNYIISKVVTCVVISFLIVFIGIFLYMFSLILMGVDYSGNNDIGGLTESTLYGVLLLKNPLVYTCCIISIYAASMSVWVVSGLMMSAYIPNSFVAVCCPLIYSYLVEEVTAFLPPYLNMYFLTKGNDILGISATYSYLYTILIFGVLIIIQGYIFGKRVVRRLGNEIS